MKHSSFVTVGVSLCIIAVGFANNEDYIQTKSSRSAVMLERVLKSGKVKTKKKKPTPSAPFVSPSILSPHSPVFGPSKLSPATPNSPSISPPSISCTPQECYSASQSEEFATALTTVANYASGTLQLSVCAGETITIPDHPLPNGHVDITLPPLSGATCSRYKLIIRCCGGNKDCILKYTGQDDTVFHFNQGPAPVSVVLDVVLEGILFFSANHRVQHFFNLDQSSDTCVNYISGYYGVIGLNVEAAFGFLNIDH